MFRILALDGGGIKGTFSASVLSTLQEQNGVSVKSSFDLIVGTSTGGILALGIGFGLQPDELLNFYIKSGPDIFPCTGRIARARAGLRQLFVSKLNSEPLEEALDAVLGDRLFGDATIPLVIPSYDAIAGRIYLFKTPHGSNSDVDANLKAVDVGLATAAAPTYFRAARSRDRTGARYVDGGVWANNPAMIGIIEAIAFHGRKLDEIAVLSIGTTAETFNISQHANSGFASWNAGLLSLLMEGQSEAASAQASLLLKDRFHRINTNVREGEYAMDDGHLQKIEQLVQLGQGEAQKRLNREAASSLFFNGKPLITKQ